MKPNDILFRAKLAEDAYHQGKRIHKGTWLVGWYYQSPLLDTTQHRLILPLAKGELTHTALDIDPDTLCQFIGLHDAKGTKVFDGDVFTVNGNYPKLVKFRSDCASFCMANVDELKDKYTYPWQRIRPDWWNEYGREIVIIGNIYDNPELLK